METLPGSAEAVAGWDSRGCYNREAQEHARVFADFPAHWLLGELLLAVPAGGRVLDVGCGAGRDLCVVRDAGFQSVGVDFAEEMVRHARTVCPEAVVEVGDARSLPFPDGSFDGVWSSAGLVHLDHASVGKALRESFRVLRPGGQVALTVRGLREGQFPAGWEDSPFGVRWYSRWTPKGMERLLTWGGFTDVQTTVEPDSSREGIVWVTASGRKSADD